MRSHRQSITILLALLTATPALAVDHPKYLEIRGRTIDAEGFAVGNVRVNVEGGRRMAMSSDANGDFSLVVPIGTVSELRRRPLRLSFWAQRSGWRFLLPNGEGRLGLEIGIEVADKGRARSFARSNQARFAAAAARIVAIEGAATGLMEVNFLGVKGKAAKEPWPPLDQVAYAPLPSAIAEQVAPPPPAPERAAAEPPRVPPAPARSFAIDTLSLVAGTKGPRLQGPSPSRAQDDSLIAWLRTMQDRAGVGTKELLKPPATAPASSPAPPEPRDETGSSKPSPAPVPDPGRDTREAASAKPEPAASQPPPAPSSSATPSGTGSGPRIIPPPKTKQSRTRARPLVISTHPTPARADTCQCRIEGIIEVREDVPLKAAQRVELSLHWYPQLRDTVELYMGSPRRFETPIAPCGPQRLKLKVLTQQKLEVETRDAMSGFHCNGDVVIQRRILLVTR